MEIILDRGEEIIERLKRIIFILEGKDGNERSVTPIINK